MYLFLIDPKLYSLLPSNLFGIVADSSEDCRNQLKAYLSKDDRCSDSAIRDVVFLSEICKLNNFKPSGLLFYP